MLLCLALLLPSRAVQAQAEVRKFSNEFLKIGVGARAAGMGNAMTALTDDVLSGYWNPAGLVRAPIQPQVALMHAEHFAGVAKYDYAAFTTRIDDDRRFAGTFIRLGIDDIPNTLNFRDGNTIDYARITAFSVADMAFLFSYAQALRLGKGQLGVGGNFKLIHRRIGDFGVGWGFGLDAGVQYTQGELALGAMVGDMTSTFNAWTYNTELFEDAFRAAGQEIPTNSIEITLPHMRLGAAYRFFAQKAVNLRASLDLELNFDGKRNVVANLGRMSIDPKMGVEASYKDIVFLRAGVMNIQEVVSGEGERVWSVYPTAGLGVHYRNFAVDYALSNVGDFSQNRYSHVFSLKITFGSFKK